MTAFTCEFSAFEGRARVKRTFKNIEAPDTYEASDRIKEMLGAAYEKMTQPVFRFCLARKPMPRALGAIVAGAGPEEE